MAPDVKIRNLDEATYDRLKARALAQGHSMESLLRIIVADAVAGDVEPDVWERSGFDEVHAMVPGRQFEVWAAGRCFRIGITETIVGGSSVHWNSSIDERLSAKIDVDGEVRREAVWTAAIGVADRLNGTTAEMALLDAIRWLSEYAGVDAVSHARRQAEAAKRMDPALREIADRVTELLGDYATASWRDETRAGWATKDLDFVITRYLHDQIALTTYRAGTHMHAFASKAILLVPDAARHIVDTMHLHMAGKGEPVPSLRAARA